MKRTMLVLASLLTVACGRESSPKCGDISQQDTSAPNVLIIGDSISMGYTPYVQQALGASADVSHNVCNAQYSANGVARIDSWLSQRDSWSLITLNHGMWDIARGTPLNEYSDNLRIIAQKAQATGAVVIFFLSTPVPENVPGYVSHDISPYNAAATAVMNQLGIPVYDLHSVADQIPQLLINPAERNDVHYQPAGYSVLGQFVSDSIRTELGI